MVLVSKIELFPKIPKGNSEEIDMLLFVRIVTEGPTRKPAASAAASVNESDSSIRLIPFSC